MVVRTALVFILVLSFVPAASADPPMSGHISMMLNGPLELLAPGGGPVHVTGTIAVSCMTEWVAEGELTGTVTITADDALNVPQTVPFVVPASACPNELAFMPIAYQDFSFPVEAGPSAPGLTMLTLDAVATAEPGTTYDYDPSPIGRAGIVIGYIGALAGEAVTSAEVGHAPAILFVSNTGNARTVVTPELVATDVEGLTLNTAPIVLDAPHDVRGVAAKAWPIDFDTTQQGWGSGNATLHLVPVAALDKARAGTPIEVVVPLHEPAAPMTQGSATEDAAIPAPTAALVLLATCLVMWLRRRG